MPFDLKNAPQTLQWLMNTVCPGLELAYMYIYIDNILLGTFEEAAHMHIRRIFDYFREHGLVIMWQNVSLGSPASIFLVIR